MAKTIVVAKHSPGPFQNGVDSCFGRWAEGGMCPGVKLAAWLNGLGEDEEFYIQPNRHSPDGTTNGRVRANWLRDGSNHIVAAEPAIAQAREAKMRAKQSLSIASRNLKILEDARKGLA